MLKFIVTLLLVLPLMTAVDLWAQAPGEADELGIEEELKREEEKAAEEKKKEIPPFKMVYVEGGCFGMGDWVGDGDDDERPVHEVCVGDFYIMETEVTKELFEAVTGIPIPPGINPKTPVTGVAWREATRFIDELNRITGGFYRLPTEAEWEYAARERGKKIRYSGADKEEELTDYAWFAENFEGGVQMVAQKKPNALGLYDMAGNVWEWTEDNFDFDFYQASPKEDPVGPDFSIWKTLRGGSVADGPHKLRTTYRYGFVPTLRSPLNGFRLAE